MKNNKLTNNAYTPEEAALQSILKDTFTDYLGLELLALEPGYCKTKLPMKPQFLNPIGGIHGGLLYTIADATAGIASVHMNSGESVTTVNGDMQFLRPALNLDNIFCEARMIKDGKRLAFTDVWINTEDGIILAKGSFTFARIYIPNNNV